MVERQKKLNFIYSIKGGNKKMKKMSILMLLLVLILVTGCSSKDEKKLTNDEIENVSEETEKVEDSYNYETIDGDVSTQTHAWETLKFTVNGETIKLNETRLNTLLDIGYTIDDMSVGAYEVEAKEHKSVYLITNNKNSDSSWDYNSQINIANEKDTAQKVNDCLIIGFSCYNQEEAEKVIIFPENITFGSTETEIIAAYGEANTIIIFDNSKTMYYLSEDNKTILNIGIKNGKVIFLSIGYALNPYA